MTWPEHQPLPALDLPDCPTGALGDILAPFVGALAAETRTPPDLAALLALASLSGALLDKAVVEVHRGWREHLALYALAVLPSGAGKSPVFVRILRPFVEHEREAIACARPAIAQAAERRRVDEARLATLRKEAAARDADPQCLAACLALAERLELAEPPTAPRLFIDDATPEKFAQLLACQGERGMLFAPEGSAFGGWAGRYSNAADFELVLRAYEGESFRVDRVVRAPLVLTRPLLAVGVCAQPSLLATIRASPADFRGRGLLARFSVIVPEACVGFRDVAGPPVPEDDEHRYGEVARALLALPDLVGPDGGSRQPRALMLSGGAHALFREASERIETSMRPHGRLASVADWASKHPGRILRLAGVLHAVEHGRDAALREHTIGECTLARALELGVWLETHAVAALGGPRRDRFGVAHDVLERVVARGEPTVPEAWIREALRRTPGAAPLLPAALDELARRGYFRKLPPPPVGPKGGRPRLPTWEVRPSLLGQNDEPAAPAEDPFAAGLAALTWGSP